MDRRVQRRTSPARASRHRATRPNQDPVSAAVFFAGIGLLGAALQKEGIRTAFANDIEKSKWSIYAKNFDPEPYVLDDIRRISGGKIPPIDLATASFPCTDLSLAGSRAGLEPRPGRRSKRPEWERESSMFWEFARVLDEMGKARPRAVLLENVPGFATSNGGNDLRDVVKELNYLGYWCDLFVVDAKWFLPQSRLRMFIVGSREPFGEEQHEQSELRPAWINRFIEDHPGLRMHFRPLEAPRKSRRTLGDVVERLAHNNRTWWEGPRVKAFSKSLSTLQRTRLRELEGASRKAWATAYRRMRDGSPVWEMRSDSISGCLRSFKGGSSKQALVEAGRDNVRVRWMTPREYARLQGAPDLVLDGVPAGHAYFGLGDAVCVPVIRWVAREYLRPILLR